jgi:hypothetical protein
MAAGAVQVGLDPLVAEAKARARRRRLLALGAILVVAAASMGTAYGLRSSGNALGVCATVPLGWKVRTVFNFPLPAPPTVVLTNFRFGRMDDLWGFTDPSLDWPANGVTVAVSNDGPAEPSVKEGPLRVSRTDFGPFEGVRTNFAQATISSHGRILDAYVKVGALTPATVAAANQALASVRTCST